LATAANKLDRGVPFIAYVLGIGAAVAVVALATTVSREFLPELDEGALFLHGEMTGRISLAKAMEMEKFESDMVSHAVQSRRRHFRACKNARSVGRAVKFFVRMKASAARRGGGVRSRRRLPGENFNQLAPVRRDCSQ
jgi:multidrug efflux pump subunit AcrB